MILDKNHGEAVHIIHSEGMAYHQQVLLHIIKLQAYARYRVMIYRPKGADDIHRPSCGGDIPSLRLG